MSHRISAMLRHGQKPYNVAGVRNFEIGQDGFVTLREVRRVCNAASPDHVLKRLLTSDGNAVDVQFLIDIVKYNDKGRFDLREETRGVISAIRANQGHSNPRVMDDLTLSSPLTLEQLKAAELSWGYHGTFVPAYGAIISSGKLVAGGARGREHKKHIHLSPYPRILTRSSGV